MDSKLTKGSVRGLVFLDEWDVPRWEEPIPQGCARMVAHNGHTRLLSYLCIESIDEHVGPFLLNAMSAKYEAVIERTTGMHRAMMEKEPVEEKSVLFYGGIIIGD